jgi:hypothetical protein
MSSVRPGRVASGLALVSLTALAVACGDSTGTKSGIDAVQTTAIGFATRDEVESAVNALAVSASTNPNGNPAPAACVTSSSAADADGDGVPNDATYTFNGCSMGTIRNGTLTLNGQVHVQDPSPTQAAFAANATHNTTVSFDAPGQANDYVAIRGGARSLSGDPSKLQLADSATVTRTVSGVGATIVRKLNVVFTPATPLQLNKPLPAGTVKIDGTSSWNRGAESFATNVSTQSDLLYDPTCTDTAQKIKAGELRLSGSFNGQQGFIRMVWNGCGSEPTYTFVVPGT